MDHFYHCTAAINRATGLWVPAVNTHWLLQVNIATVEMKMPSRLSAYEVTFKFAHNIHVPEHFWNIKLMGT